MEDLWCKDSPLKVEFNGVHNLAVNNFELVGDNFEASEGGGWTPILRNLNDWEFEEMVGLLGCLNGFFPNSGGE